MTAPNGKLSEVTRYPPSYRGILKEIVMKQWLNKCEKILARISGKTITRFQDLWTQEKVNEICIWTTDRRTDGKLPSSLICLLEKKNGKAEFHVVSSATQLCGPCAA